MRRATSCQAAAFCARRSSVRSSSTSTKPELARRGPRELTVTAACINRPAAMISSARELVDLRARIAELRGHGVERTNQDAKLVVGLLRNLVFEIAGRDFASAFGERLDGYGNLFGEIKSDP